MLMKASDWSVSRRIRTQIYAGVRLTTIARQCGTSVVMIEKHNAGIIENWDGRQVPADEQIRDARKARRTAHGATSGR